MKKSEVQKFKGKRVYFLDGTSSTCECPYCQGCEPAEVKYGILIGIFQKSDAVIELDPAGNSNLIVKPLKEIFSSSSVAEDYAERLA